MARPRQTFPGQFYLLTRRTIFRMYLLTPSQDTNNAFIYCFAVAAQRCNIAVLMPYAASNHTHSVIYDHDGRVSEFMEHFHKLFARCQNARLGRWEPLWSPTEPGVTRLLDRQTVIDKLVYVAANPVQDLLVERVHHWPGVNGYTSFVNQRPLHARRPRHFFREGGDMPAEVTLELVIPPQLGDPDQVIAEVKAGVKAVEEEMRRYRAANNKRVVGKPRIRAHSWTDSPDSVAPRRRLNPRFAGPTDKRIAALLEFKAFLADYGHARTQLVTGRSAVFPPGTYWLARFAAVTVRPRTAV